MAKQSQVSQVTEADEYAVFHLVDLKEKRKAEVYFKALGVEIDFYFLTIFKEPGESSDPVRVHSIFIKNPSDLKRKLLDARNNFLVENMKIAQSCSPRETVWKCPTDTWINMSSSAKK
ncbi:MAG: hypothetical protein ACD_5C00027G0002 [uncultured bacterium]|nr:MAG: hypothetical protein ACD_5C00027G0002 [uncultured bacterium]